MAKSKPLFDAILQTLPVPVGVVQNGGDEGCVACLGVLQELRAKTTNQVQLLGVALHLSLRVLKTKIKKKGFKWDCTTCSYLYIANNA